MTDIRMIDIKKNGEIEITGSQFHKHMTRRESAIQYIVISILTTPATNVEDPSFGGGGFLLVNKLRSKFEDTKTDVAEVIHQANINIVKARPDFGDYTVTGINLKSIEKKERGFNVIVSVDFLDALTERITIPGRSNVDF